MKAAHYLGVQTAIILAMVLFVSWPQFRPVRAQSVWRYVPSAAQQARTDDAAQYSDTGAVRRTSVAAGTPRFTTQVTQPEISGARDADSLKAGNAFVPPQEVVALGGKLNALVGLARTSLNMPIPYAKVLLRNIRTGKVQARGTANDLGQFSFLDLDESTYVVELLGADGSVVAASQMVILARGELRQTEVRAAASATTLVATFGNSLTPTMPQITTVAIDNNVTRTTPALLAEESSR